MLYGEYRHHVDAKGRVALPAALRRELPSGSVIAVGPDARLVIRPPEVWAELERNYQMTAETPLQLRDYLRILYSSARALETDAQGRMLLIDAHRRWASIADRAVFIGIGKVVEIVGEDLWDAGPASVGPAEYTKLNDKVMSRAGNAPALTATSA